MLSDGRSSGMRHADTSDMMQPQRPSHNANLYKVAAIGAWILFLLRLMSEKDLSSTTLFRRLWLQPTAEIQVVLNWPAPSAGVQAVRVVTERGEPSLRESWTMNRIEGTQALAIRAAGPGRLTVKVAGLDVAGCSLFGGAVDAVVGPKPRSPLALHIDLKKLDVPLCN